MLVITVPVLGIAIFSTPTHAQAPVVTDQSMKSRALSGRKRPVRPGRVDQRDPWRVGADAGRRQDLAGGHGDGRGFSRIPRRPGRECGHGVAPLGRQQGQVANLSHREWRATWSIQFVSTDQRAFFDCIAFWDARRGIAISDAVEKAFILLRTEDGGATETGGGSAGGGRRRGALCGERHLPPYWTRWRRLVRHRGGEDRARREEPRLRQDLGDREDAGRPGTRHRPGSPPSRSGTSIAGLRWEATSTSQRIGRRTSRSARIAGRPGRPAEASPSPAPHMDPRSCPVARSWRSRSAPAVRR